MLQPREIHEIKEYDTDMKREKGRNKFLSILARCAAHAD